MNAPGNALQPVVETALSLSIGDDAILGGSLKVHRVAGHEAISTPFRYEIELMREGGSLSSGQVLGKDATLEISVTDGDTMTPGDAMVRRVHGVVEELLVEESVGDDGHAEHRYRVVLVPRLAALARNRQNRIHATSAHQTLEQVIRHKLRSSGPDYGRDEAREWEVLEDDEFRIDIDAGGVPVAQLSHVAQHNETDLDFIRRLCERHGVYFFFASNAEDADDAEDTRGMVVFGNTNTPFGVIRFEKDAPVQTTGPEGSGANPAGWGPSVAGYPETHKLDIELELTGATGLTGGSTHTPPTPGEAGPPFAPARPAKLRGALFEFRSVRRPVPARVNVIADRRVQSRNETTGIVTTPDLKRTVTRAGGSGNYTDYDTHFSTQEAGDGFAAIRSQELRAANHYFIGSTNSPCVAPGRTFTKMPDEKRFLVTAVDIEVTHAHSPGMADIEGEVIQTGIINRFRCIEFDEAGEFVYRPPRVTPVPRVHGVHTAWIGTGEAGEAGRPVLDADGAYRIYSRFLDERVERLDEEDAQLRLDALSKAVRKGEPYAGEDVGMHFPLKRDTEVLVAYRNGDPDRPVIAAAMPGAVDHASPVTGANPTSHVIRTSSGARFEIHDGDQDSDSRIVLRSRKDFADASYVRLGKADTKNAQDPETLEDHYEKSVVIEGEGKRDGIALYTADNIRDATRKDRITEAEGSVRVRAEQDIHGRSAAKHLLRGRRMVIVSGGADDEPGDGERIDIGGDEVQVENDDMLLLSKGNVYIKADEDIRTTVAQSVTTEVDGDEIRRTSGDTVSHHYGLTQRYERGSSHSLTLGASTNVVVGHAGLAVFGGWLRPWGPLSLRLYTGYAYYLWPQAFILQATATVTNLLVDCRSSGNSVRKTNLSCKKSFIRHRLRNTNVQTVANKASILGVSHTIL